MITDLLTLGTILFAVVFWGANRPWSIALFSSLAILTLAIALIGDIWRGRLRLRVSGVFFPLIGFLTLVCVQYLRPNTDLDSAPRFLPHTVEPYATALYLLAAFACFALLFCVLNGFRSRQRVVGLVIAILSLGVLESSYGLIQWLGGIHSIWGTPTRDHFAHGTMLNHNHYALLVNIAISAGVGYLYARTLEMLDGQKLTLRSILAMPALPKLGWILVWLAIMGVSVLAAASRMGIFAMFICLGFMLTAVWLAEGRKYASVLVLLVVVAITCVGLYAGIDAAFERYAELAQPGQLEAGRLSLWHDAWPMIWKTPWFGKGLGSFQWTFRAYETEAPDIPAVYAHNDYLQVVAETGITGLCLVIWAFAACLKTARRNLLDLDPMVRGIGLAAVGALSAAAVQEITDYSLYIPGTAALFILLVGLNERARWLSQERSMETNQKV